MQAADICHKNCLEKPQNLKHANLVKAIDQYLFHKNVINTIFAIQNMAFQPS